MTTTTLTRTAADNRVPDEVDARLTALVTDVAARRKLHHVNLAVIGADGERRWAGAAGPNEPGTPELTTATPFFIASVTKRFIITLVLQAHERGELDLDESITTYLPPATTTGLHVLRGVDHTAQITVRHLASHTSGLPDYFDKPREGPSLYRRLMDGEDLAWSLEDVLRWTREQHRPHFAPQDLTADRQTARYSDTGFQLLIHLLETVTGQGFAELLSTRICEPLGLEHTWLPGRSVPAAGTPEPSGLYDRQRRLDLPNLVRSSNDLGSTTEDLLTFQRALLAGGLFRNDHTVALLTERSNRLRNMPAMRYGLGTMTFRVNRLAGPGHRPVTLVGHAGVTGSWLFHCPELDVHLAGTVDQSRGRATPFRLMAQVLRAW
jgi:D-alanyl-D-alanine carboxypeptidase